MLGTSFWVIEHLVYIFSYLLWFLAFYVPEVSREEVSAPDPCYPIGSMAIRLSGHAKKNEFPQASKTGHQIYPPYH